MVDEVPNRDTGCEFGKPANVITVVMGRDEVIDLRDTRILRRGHDAPGVPGGGGAAVSGIDQKRLA